jgi:outer membrane protein assembly factor BamA
MVPRKNLPYPLTTDRFRDPVKVVTIPLPVIAASPNEGVSYGGLTAFLLHNGDDEVDTLVAPQLNYNENFGVTGTVYGTFYVSPDREWEFNVSKSTKVNEDYEIRFRDKSLLGKNLELSAFVYGWTDGSARFFGFGPASPQGQETNFGDREIGFTLSAGYPIADHLQIVLGERFRDVGILPGALPALPFLRDVFPPAQVPGADGFTTHVQKLSLVYDTTSPREMPVRGIYAQGAVEGSLRALGSFVDFLRYEVEVKGYLPLQDSRYVTAARFAYSQVRGSGVPFLERSVLGGENMLRGFGRNRFVDMGSLLLNVEERIRLFRWKLFNVNADWEVAPFLDIGTVMESIGKIAGHAVEFNPGIGFRAAVRPNIVGRIDVGFGKEGAAVYVGLRYPF